MTRRTDAGFSLVEVLASFAILALVTLAIYRGFVESQGGVSQDQARYEATEFARSLLDQMRVEHRVAEMPRAGTYREIWFWDLMASPSTQAIPVPYQGLVELWDVEVTIRSTDGDELAILRTTFLETRP